MKTIPRSLIVLSCLAAPAVMAAPTDSYLDTPAGTALIVNSLGDDTTPGDGLVTLREAIIAANSDGSTDLGQTGDGADLLDLSGLQGVIVLESPLPPITSDITIFGPGANPLHISGGSGSDRHRPFFIDGGDLQIVGVTVRDGRARGGNGGICQQRSGCGGGGAGLGGAIFLNSGSLRLLGVVVSDSEAEGGSGGSRILPAGDHGGGGGGGILLHGGDPAVPEGGAGADGAPLAGLGGSPGGGGGPGAAGGDGAGGGGGRSWDVADAPGGPGGFGGGGGGGGRALGTGGLTPEGGPGGFGGGGGGRGCRPLTGDGPGAPGGVFGGEGGPSSGEGNIAGGGGGGGGLGGAIFARSGSIDLQDVAFVENHALRGSPGTNSGNSGTAGMGKGGALFLMPAATAILSGVTFSDNTATDASGNGYEPGQASDTHDVYGLVADVDRLFAYGFE